MKLESIPIPVGDKTAMLLRGPPRGPAVVLVHGASGNAATWTPIANALTWATPVVVDLPGRGGSAAWAALDRAEDVATWLGQVLDAAGIEAPLIAGHSYGGAVALSLALQRPGAQTVALVSSGSKLKVAPAIFDLVRKTSTTEPLRFDFAFGPNTPARAVNAYHDLAQGVSVEASVGDWTGCDHFDLRARLSEVEDRCLVLWGDEDTLTPPKRQQMLAEGLPHAVAVELNGVGHMLPWEAPERFADALRAFANKA